jgi:hypothetical protein
MTLINYDFDFFMNLDIFFLFSLNKSSSLSTNKHIHQFSIENKTKNRKKNNFLLIMNIP